MTYGAETWTVTKADETKVIIFEQTILKESSGELEWGK